MKNQAILPLMESTDCVLSSCIADINMDSVNEILLGTYSQEVFVFSFLSQNSCWKLLDKRKFDAPVHSMCYLDLTGDGMKELVVLTQRGVYILQVNFLMFAANVYIIIGIKRLLLTFRVNAARFKEDKSSLGGAHEGANHKTVKNTPTPRSLT